jgi:hypothetical protein
LQFSIDIAHHRRTAHALRPGVDACALTAAQRLPHAAFSRLAEYRYHPRPTPLHGLAHRSIEVQSRLARQMHRALSRTSPLLCAFIDIALP